jgi:hypothetical protein
MILKKKTGNLQENMISYGVKLCKGGTGMDLNWFESIIYGLFLGLTDILPVSAQAHKLLLLKLFGVKNEPGLMRLLIHVSVLGAVYYNCLPQIVKILRAKSLARIPKRRRKRPLDTKSLMDYSLWKTMLLPVILSFFLYEKVQALESQLVWVSVFVLLNGLTDILISRNENYGFFVGKTGTHNGTDATPPAPPRTSSTRKYICPCCGMSVRATRVVRIACIDCDEQMVEV